MCSLQAAPRAHDAFFHFLPWSKHVSEMASRRAEILHLSHRGLDMFPPASAKCLNARSILPQLVWDRDVLPSLPSRAQTITKPLKMEAESTEAKDLLKTTTNLCPSYHYSFFLWICLHVWNMDMVKIIVQCDFHFAFPFKVSWDNLIPVSFKIFMNLILFCHFP